MSRRHVNISDPIAVLEAIFLGGKAIPPPTDTAGEDPTPDAMTCSVLER